ncbi:hypothetical protein C0993_012201 [Termitomyces sp. T159_Od127]|nr:hypothetical protein C0993_012201 [Termitomyces sp. T159_Od127]
MSSSTVSNMTGINASGETFGPRRLAHRGPNNAAKTPTTPASQDAQTNSQRTTPRSASDQSHSGRSRGNTVSSSNTFGVPSPKSIPVKRRKPSMSSTGLPPLPPLDHPAFKTATVNRDISLVNRNVTGMSAFEHDEMGQSKITRHSHSLPSLSHLKTAPSDFTYNCWYDDSGIAIFVSSPDLRLQVAHTHHTPAAKHCGTTSGPLYQGTFEQKSSHIAMSKNNSQISSPATQSHSPERSRTPSPPSKLNTVAFTSSAVPSTSHLVPPSLSFTAATPEASPVTPILRSSALITPTEPVSSVLRAPSSSSASTERPASSKGKRKADEAGVGVGGTPPKEAKEPRATFAIEPRRHRASANSNATSNAPSSYHRKRARLSAPQESRPNSCASNSSNQTKNQNAATTGSWSSKMSKNSGFVAPHHTPSLRPVPTSYHTPQRESSRRSISQASIPMSALISPHAPSISPSTTFHMRDPRKPAPIQSTSWSLSLPVGSAEPGEGWRGWIDRGGSPLHAWLFFVGFVLFPLWWVASCMRIPKTRTLDGQEKGVVMIDDPQVEHGASRSF